MPHSRHTVEVTVFVGDTKSGEITTLSDVWVWYASFGSQGRKLAKKLYCSFCNQAINAEAHRAQVLCR